MSATRYLWLRRMHLQTMRCFVPTPPRPQSQQSLWNTASGSLAGSPWRIAHCLANLPGRRCKSNSTLILLRKPHLFS